jgi:hypothetical protein
MGTKESEKNMDSHESTHTAIIQTVVKTILAYLIPLKLVHIFILLTIPTYILNKYQPDVLVPVSSYITTHIPNTWHHELIPSLVRIMVALNYSFVIGFIILILAIPLRELLHSIFHVFGIYPSDTGYLLRETVTKIIFISVFLFFALISFAIAFYFKTLVGDLSLFSYLQSSPACWVTIYPFILLQLP